MEVTGSIELECERRLTNLYQESHNWLLGVAYKVTRSHETAEDMVSELYEYLHKRKNQKLFFGETSYNLLYCSKFLRHRFINKTKKLNRISYTDTIFDMNEDEENIEYDTEKDLLIQRTHEEIINELKALEATKMWPQAKIASMYFMSDDTLDELAKKIGISKSTVFLAVRKMKTYLREVIENPFNDKEENRRN